MRQILDSKSQNCIRFLRIVIFTSISVRTLTRLVNVCKYVFLREDTCCVRMSTVESQDSAVRIISPLKPAVLPSSQTEVNPADSWPNVQAHYGTAPSFPPSPVASIYLQ